MNLSWYLHRAAAMGPFELARRGRDALVKMRTGWEEGRLASTGSKVASGGFATPFRVGVDFPPRASEDLLESAASLASGRLPVFGQIRTDMVTDPDWFLDPKTGLGAPRDQSAFRINHRNWPGSAKHVWEPSRHHHLTVLAAAVAVSGDPSHSQLLMAQLESWWRANPPFRGIQWVSGIELGLRLFSWVWIRRLLESTGEASGWFEENPRFLDQLYAHQVWLDRLPSFGTSANNHAVAEAAGQFAASCAFPVFPESSKWRDRSSEALTREMSRQVDGDGVHRELAMDYHGFVCELFLIAGLEGLAAGLDLGDRYWAGVRSMIDVVAATLDATGRPPRQGDSDDGYGLIVDGAGFDRWASLLETGAELFGRPGWWPAGRRHGDVRTACLTRLASVPSVSAPRRESRPSSFSESGLTILRSWVDGSDEIWCRCDGGPLGFLSTAAHGHADALSVEVRRAGVDVLADPGTYCYQVEPVWRTYFRSIRAHNTLELAAAVTARPTGPFMWAASGRTTTLEVATGSAETWSGSCVRRHRHGGEIEHKRSVSLVAATLTIEDIVSMPTAAVLRFHLGPDIDCELEGSTAFLTWTAPDGAGAGATIDLPSSMSWASVRGREDPPLGWYSPRFDVRVPSVTLEGSGELDPDVPLVTRLQFATALSA